MSRRNRDEETLPVINKAILEIERSTEAQYSAKSQVERAFLLGLWYKRFPEYTLEHLEKAYGWNHMELMPEGTGQYEDPYRHFLHFQFTADTGDSWHQCYRDFREHGWQRLKVHRDGGRLQYLLKLEANFTWAHEGNEGAYKVYDKPKGFCEIYLVLDIAIATCKTIQVGTETKEVPVMKTVCEDLVELPEDASNAGAVASPPAEVISLVVIDDIDELQRRHETPQDDIIF
jgi:hypothetical protein